MEEYDVCYECTGYGDDYYLDDKGEMQCACDDCPYFLDFLLEDED